mmetsp:Transcript_51242/g.92099  ORF Transcript_51242/g.92099 Transcript_51242/m.92099 type:complete len:100 (+) Transcript_51242:42-341(+)
MSLHRKPMLHWRLHSKSQSSTAFCQDEPLRSVDTALHMSGEILAPCRLKQKLHPTRMPQGKPEKITLRLPDLLVEDMSLKAIVFKSDHCIKADLNLQLS